MRRCVAVVGLALWASIAGAQAPATGPAGGGFAGVEDTHLAKPGHGAVGYLFDNYDRDPGGIDVADSRLLWRVGVWQNTEAFGSLLVARGVVTPGNNVFPSPPTDFVVISGTNPGPPFRPIYQYMPYLGDISTDAGSFSLGDAELGIKHRVRVQDGFVPELALSLSASVPLRRNISHLRAGFGTGSIDNRLMTALAWSIGHTRIAANLGYRLNGNLRYDDRVIDSSGVVTRQQVNRPDMLMYGVGVHRKITSWLSVSGQFMGWRPTGHRTSSFNESGADDLIGGIHFTFRQVTLTASVRQHLASPPTDRIYGSGIFAGAVVLGMQDNADYFQAIGVGNPQLRPDAQTIIMDAPIDVPLPPGAYRIPETYRYNTTGNTGSVISLSYSF